MNIFHNTQLYNWKWGIDILIIRHKLEWYAYFLVAFHVTVKSVGFVPFHVEFHMSHIVQTLSVVTAIEDLLNEKLCLHILSGL